MPQEEILQPDSLVWQWSNEEIVVKKTTTEMLWLFNEEVKMSRPDFVIRKVIELNPEAEIEADFDRGIIYSSVSVQELNLPEWFYYNQKNGITNKHNTQSGIYGSVHVYPIEYSDQYSIYY